MAGIGIALAGAGLGVAIIIQKLTGSTLLPGYASLASIALLGFGLQMGCMGLLGLYMGKIFREVQNRPLYIVQEIFEQQHGDTQ
jgi:dolichol-phosphate mannosyltransferase